MSDIIVIANASLARKNKDNIFTGINTFENDVDFSGMGKGLPFGSFYADNISQTVTIGSPNTPYQISSGFTGDGLNNFVFQNARELKCLVAGNYKVDWSLAVMIASGLNIHIEGMVMINGAAQYKTVNTTHLITSNDEQSIGGTGIISLNVNDLVSLGVENDDGTQNVIVTHGNLSLVQVGG